MEILPTFLAQTFASLFGIVALILFCLGLYWIFNKKAKQRHLAEIRAKLDELSPTDPEYNQVRALHTSLILDGYRWDSLYGSKSENNTKAPDGSGKSYSQSDGPSEAGGD